MNGKEKVLMAASVASMIDQFNMPNIIRMQQMGYEVHVACNFKEGNTCDDEHIQTLKKTLGRMDVILHQWDCPRSICSIKKCQKAYRQILKLMHRHSFAWMHCHSPVGGALARIAAHRAGIPAVYTAHGFHFYKGAPLKNWLLYYPAEKLLAHWTNVMITVNREDYALAKKCLPAKEIFHIPGIGIDTEKFQSVKDGLKKKKQFCRKYGIPEHAILLLSVGELNKGKNHRMVIKALAAIRRTDVYYMICGQGRLFGRLQRYADHCGVGERVKLVGYQEDMPFIYHNTDIFVFPSIREGMPVALMEAMAAGIPCIVSDIRGNRELMGSACHPYAGRKLQTGRFVDKQAFCLCTGGIKFLLRQPKGLQSALEELLSNENLRKEYGRCARTQIKAYRRAVVDKKMKRIYHRMAGEAVLYTGDGRRDLGRKRRSMDGK